MKKMDGESSQRLSEGGSDFLRVMQIGVEKAGAFVPPLCHCPGLRACDPWAACALCV